MRGYAKVHCRVVLIYKHNMSINIKFSDLEEVIITNSGTANAYVDSAFHKQLNRDLTEAECDSITDLYFQELYELHLSRF